MYPLFHCIALLLPALVFSKDYFTAAVFEHRPRYNAGVTLNEVKELNLHLYRKAAVLASEKGADIIIFNEYGTFPYPYPREDFYKLAEHIPDPRRHKFNPCTEKATDRPVLFTGSCLARENNMFVMLNVGDIQQCESSCDAVAVDDCESKCPEDGVYLYNTDVAFDREGYIVARYHKMHPYFEIVDVPLEPEFITFDTDFGRFGMIVCFDSVWPESVELVEKYKVDTMIFPTYWFDDIIFQNAVEFQQAWAIANGVNFLSSNTHASGTGSLGTGIYSKDQGALVYTYEPDGESKLLVANVGINGKSKFPVESFLAVINENEIIPQTETGDKFPEYCLDKVIGPAKDEYNDYRCFKEKAENYTLVKLETPSGTVQACNNGFCCSLMYNAEAMDEDFYLGAFNGLNNVKGCYEWWEETCALVRCDSHKGRRCALESSRSKTVFEETKLEAHFTAEKVYPSVSKTKNRLALRDEWTFTENEGKTVLEFKSKNSQPLLKMVLFGRRYERDPTYKPCPMG